MSTSNPTLQTLLQRPDLWRLQDCARLPAGLATGFEALDAALHDRGWPRAALTELLLDRPGIGELQLLLPALADVSRQQLWQVWINPPFIPYAPVLAQAGIDLATLLIVRTEPRQQLWACEQALRSAASGAVLYWPAQALRYAELRKLQVAAGAQQSLAFILRGSGNAAHTSPAALRLQLAAADGQLSLQVLKQRGGRSGQQVLLPRPALWGAQVALSQREALVAQDLAALRIEKESSDFAERFAPPPRRRIVDPIASRRPLARTFSVRSARHATH